MNEIYDRLAALADPVRGRILALLSRHELAVSELAGVLQAPQSSTSRQLKVLADEGWLVQRAEGTSRYYRLSPRLEPAARRLWQAVREEVERTPAAKQDEARARRALAQRRTRAQEFFSTAAAQWDSLRAELFGARAELVALPGLLDPGWRVGDLGCGTGQLAATVAPFVSAVVGVDRSKAMLEAARRRLTEHGNVALHQGELESLPLENASLDAAIMFLVLHYVADPEQALAEAARVLRPGGRLLVVDMLEHDRADLRERMGHVWPGFTQAQLGEWLESSGFATPAWRPLPPAAEAKGPLLFAATAYRCGAGGLT